MQVKNEVKHSRFVRVAEQRTQKALDAIKSLAKCSDTSMYEYTEMELTKIFCALEAELSAMKESFASGGKGARFVLARDGIEGVVMKGMGNTAAPAAGLGYRIMQLRKGDENTERRFLCYESHKRLFGTEPDRSRYEEVHRGMLGPGSEIPDALDILYEKYNTEIPEDFRGHSLSVSDAIVIEQADGTERWYFVDSIGFREI